jgi:hypothetical protein
VLVVCIVLLGVFAVGFCSGKSRGFYHDGYRGGYDGGYPGQMMLRGGDWDGPRATNIQYRMMGGFYPETQAVSATVAPVAK